MQLEQVFAKDIQRPIEGVIKADDAIHLGTEIDEYVVTNEVEKSLEQLLESYTNYKNANGVWISGFFGSGKSHLLKMLAHLLGDVEGQSLSRSDVSQRFAAKLNGNAFVTASLAKAAHIPSKSLLFNIDQKASLISKDQSDALLKVFVKVFDEARGYYGNQGHVARFERDLDRRGKLEAFKDAYSRIANRDWLRGREEGVLEESNIARAYAEITGQGNGSPTNILTKYRNEYTVSIEDFADEVKDWLDHQEDGYRLNFFVDEVGQFIGSNTHLMLNLQTIAESLNTKCKGRAWVIVTSQEDVEKILGDRTRAQGNDFSKIQARFETRLKLTSADVEEVIRKRLLTKNNSGRELLSSLYAIEHQNFKTLFDFADRAKVYRNYIDKDHFIDTYPFVPYQFPLFQAAIESISDHNVFEGRNSSVGERSMLGVVQHVAREIGPKKIGSLATFDQMFAGIRASLKSAAQRSIDVAERNLDDKLAVRVLKALFLVKYVDDFKATARNLTVLVFDTFRLNIRELDRMVQESLDLLEKQNYVHRNGNVYEYLTNEEQIIEAEIKNVEIDASEVSSRLNTILSTEVIKNSRIHYIKTGQNFSFGYKLDDQAFGKQFEITLHFITPEYPYEPQQIRMHSAAKDELRVILAPDERIMVDLRLLIKTEKFIKRKISSSISASEQRILQNKATQNNEREKELVERVRRAVGKAELVQNATDVPSSSQDAQGRISDGFQVLISRVYTHLKTLGKNNYTERDIASFADPQSAIFDDYSISPLAAAGEEVLSFILQKDKLGEQVTVKTIIDYFHAKPYGWDIPSIRLVIAWLIGASKVVLTRDSNSLKRSEVAEALQDTQKYPHIIISLQKVFDPGKISSFRAFCTDFFDDPTAPKDPLELANFGSLGLRSKLNELEDIVNMSPYPFVEQLNGPINLLNQCVGKKDEWYLTEFALGDALLETKESLIDPITSFLNNSGQRAIYDEAATLLSENSSNINYMDTEASKSIKQALADPDAFRGNRMRKLKGATLDLKSALQVKIDSQKSKAREDILTRCKGLRGMSYYLETTEDARQIAENQISELLNKIDSESQIPVINDIANDFVNTGFPRLLDRLANNRPTPATDEDHSAIDNPVPEVRESLTISINTLHINTKKSLIENTSDVEDYLNALRHTLEAVLNNGNRIAL